MFSPEEFKFIQPGEVRTRFAPSPTGLTHLGSTRTALFNYLFAKKYKGVFVLRIEDTDKKRSKPEYEKDIMDSLRWLGIKWDEGPDIEGPYGPYRQRERLNIYAKYLKKLLNEDKAYYCFCSEEELEAQRQYQMSLGEAPKYSGKCADLPKETVKKYLTEEKPSVIRFRMASKKVSFDDLIRGNLEFDTALMGDMVIAKDLSTPLYNFAAVIDDFEMKISHIIRGEDHISNTPKQILIQEALGFNQPEYAHLPLILGPDRAKLSKRHGAVAVSEFKQEGYLPETLINFMAFLGWNPGDEREIYSLASLVKEFSLERCQKGGAVFNVKRLDFLNGFYIRQKSAEKLTEICLPYLIAANLVEPIFETKERVPDLIGYFGKEIIQGYIIKETGEKIDFEYLKKIVSIYQERLKKLSEIVELTDFFFREKIDYDKNLLKWKDMEDREVKNVLDKLEKILSEIDEKNWTKENLEKILLLEAEKLKNRGALLWPLRAALTGKEASAGPFEIAETLGKQKTLKRIKKAKELL